MTVTPKSYVKKSVPSVFSLSLKIDSLRKKIKKSVEPNSQPMVDLELVAEEIFLAQKTLFELRMKKRTSQTTKPHLFTHTKRKLAQLNTLKNSLLKITN